jgi:hypothetical protein
MSMRLAPLVAVPLLVLAVACGSDSNTPVASGDAPSTTTTAPAPPGDTSAGCSMSGVRVAFVEQSGLPEAVISKRKEILATAAACDYRALGALAGPQFNYSFGSGKGDASAYWHKQEDEGTPVMRELSQILDLPHATRELPDGGGTYYSWPSADQDVRTQADWDALKGVYTDEQVAAFQKDDLYTGYRAAITETGDWMYFVSGD